MAPAKDDNASGWKEFSSAEGQFKVSFPGTVCKKPVEMGEITPRALKLRMLRALDEIITKRPSPPINFKAWLAARHAYYKAWLARLNAGFRIKRTLCAFYDCARVLLAT